MYGEFPRDNARNPEPLPPARTRWAEEAGNGPGTSGSLLGPVHSGPAGRVTGKPPSRDEAEVFFGVGQQVDDWASEEVPADWDEVEAGPALVHEIVMETETDSEIVLVFESEAVEIVVESDDEDPDLVAESAAAREAPEPPADLREGRATPLSAWGLATRSVDSAERARRAREEWDDLEQALVESIGSPTEPQRERAGPAGRPHIPTELEELARRLEQFAAALRADGTRAMEMAQSRGDPIDVVLAALAAGYVSGRRE